MKERNYQRGAISVFLAIILIPCIVISGMFVDLSRVKLSQGVATSAADLALNSLMANYDKDLSDYYGLMASCQNIETFYEESAQYFLQALYSQGLSADDAESLMTHVASLFNNDQIHDLFQMDVQTETKDIIKAYKGGNSTEASLGTSSVIMKDQIVEFMKYRAPINITSKIITRLKESSADKTFGDAKEDDQLVKDKQEYAEAEESFMDAAFKTYKALLKYEKEGMDNDTMKSMISNMKTAREIYREVTKLMVSNFNGTNGLTQFSRPTYSIDEYSYDKTSNKVYSRKEGNGSETTYYIDGARITGLLDSLEINIDKFKSARDAVASTATDTLVNASIGTGGNQYNAIQWWKKVDSLVNSGSNSKISQFAKAAEKMLDSYAKVLAIGDCELGNDIPSDWQERYNRLTQSAKDLQKDFLTAGVPEKNNNKYLRLVNKLEYYSKANINNINPDLVTISNGQTVSGAIKWVDDTLSGHVTKLDSVIKKLDKLIEGGGIWKNNPYSLNSLSNKADDYHNKYNTWKNYAYSHSTPMAQSDQDEIAGIESEKGKIIDVSKQQIQNFKTRLVKVRQRLVDIKSDIESMKFGSKELIDISSTNTAYEAVKGGIGENLKNSEVANKASSLFSSKFTPYSANSNAEVVSYNFNDKSCNPDLENVNPPEFYTWLKDKFNRPVEEIEKNVKEKKQEKNTKKNEKEDTSKNAKEANRSDSASKTNLYGNSNYSADDFPSGLDAKGRFSLADGLISSVGDVISSIVNMNFEGIRDSLYSTEYVMDMFSYATYVNEGKYNLCIKKGNSAADIEGDYENKYNDVTGNKDTEGSWLSAAKTDTYNKTLTNFMIDSNNNILHGAEAEYILFGKENDKNIKSAYTKIFEIRFILNTLSGFKNFWRGDNITAEVIETFAIAVSELTAGIVPAPVIKCVAILLLTAFETAEDLSRLQKGFKVEIFKDNYEDWRKALDSNLSEKTGNGKACENGLFYSDYIYLFLLMGFGSESSASEMYRRTGDLIQVNMRKYTNNNSYVLKNARSYFELNAKIRVKPLLLALPIAQGFSNNPKDKNDWCTFDLHEIRGYS